MEIIPTTSDMERHMSTIEIFGPPTANYTKELENQVDTYLKDGEKKDFDDTEIYNEIKDNKDSYNYDKKTLTPKEEIIVEKISKSIMKRGLKTKDDLFEF